MVRVRIRERAAPAAETAEAAELLSWDSREEFASASASWWMVPGRGRVSMTASTSPVQRAIS